MEIKNRQHFKELRQIYQRRLEILQKQAASFGLYAPPHIGLEIEDIKQKVTDIDLQFPELKQIIEQPSEGKVTIDQTDNRESQSQINENEHIFLNEKLSNHFNTEEVRTLCFSLNVDYDNLPADGKSNKVRELILHCIRNQCIDQLKVKCKELRPKVSWD